jgi:hypothetical protein
MSLEVSILQIDFNDRVLRISTSTSACIFSSFLHIMTLVCTLVVFESYPIVKQVTAALKAYTQ